MTNKINGFEYAHATAAVTIGQSKISLDIIEWPKPKLKKEKQFDLDLMLVQAKSRLEYSINANANFHLKQMKNEYEHHPISAYLVTHQYPS